MLFPSCVLQEMLHAMSEVVFSSKNFERGHTLHVYVYACTHAHTSTSLEVSFMLTDNFWFQFSYLFIASF